ncbi:helix-turn-helix transcriptional regulator [Streptococcus pseudopneumoniae]|uniref:Putative transcriptional regulator n=1 Tax=Streptococcus pseudopneumoniae TaxID=257758 RepID=A0A0T8U5X2_9STRE|nr:helix-turn-helix transcriptional regulator [Streptococcus pseudopneumoniae]CKA87120.1 putative transcriptional regulator [Streptococcus pseudopneumoniae]VTY21414.1 Helix-turn-helix domain protein [uncultured Streptococcus sp.]HEU6131767.1 XRE family transcriptional regulator [Streptococcus pneumoniae]
MDNNDLLFRKPPNRLEKLMENHGVTLKEVSENTGIPITTLSGYKKNQRAPKKNNAEILAEYFGVSVAYLMGLDDVPSRDSGILHSPKEDLEETIKLMFDLGREEGFSEEFLIELTDRVFKSHPSQKWIEYTKAIEPIKLEIAEWQEKETELQEQLETVQSHINRLKNQIRKIERQYYPDF